MGWHCHFQDTLIPEHNLMTITRAGILELGPEAPCQAICLGPYFRSYKYKCLGALLTRSLILSYSSILQLVHQKYEVKCLATDTVNP